MVCRWSLDSKARITSKAWEGVGSMSLETQVAGGFAGCWRLLLARGGGMPPGLPGEAPNFL